MPEFLRNIPVREVANAVRHSIQTTHEVFDGMRGSVKTAAKATARAELLLAGSALLTGWAIGRTADINQELTPYPAYAVHGVDNSLGNLNDAVENLAYIPPAKNGDGNITSPVYPNPSAARTSLGLAAEDFPDDSSIARQIRMEADRLPQESVAMVVNGEFVTTETFNEDKAEIAEVIGKVDPLKQTPTVLKAEELKAQKPYETGIIFGIISGLVNVYLGMRTLSRY